MPLRSEQRSISTLSTTGLTLPTAPGGPGRDVLFIDTITVSGGMAANTQISTLTLLGGATSVQNTGVSTTAASNAISRGVPFLNAAVGNLVTGVGIPAGTTITTVTDTTHLVLSANATSTGTVSVIITGGGTGNTTVWATVLQTPVTAAAAFCETFFFPPEGLAIVDGTGQNIVNPFLVYGGTALTAPILSVTYHFSTRS